MQKGGHGYLVSNKHCCTGKSLSTRCKAGIGEAFVGRRWDQREISTMVSTVGGPRRGGGAMPCCVVWWGRGPAAVLLRRGAPAGRAGTGGFSYGWGGAAGLERCAAR